MQLVQISDLHISANSNHQIMKNKIDQLVSSIKSKVKHDEEVILCVLGDIIDKGDEDAIGKAKEILEHLKSKLGYFPLLKTAIVPGNHDLCLEKETPLRGFNEICSLFDFHCHGEMECTKIKLDSIDIILVNSVFHQNSGYGKINLESIKREGITKNTLLVMHHSIFGVNNEDTSSIKNGYEILNFINNNGNIVGILHGHTHGYKNVVVGDKCRIIGVGPFFKNVEDINNQCNVISIDHNGVNSVDNYSYRADFGNYDSTNVFLRKLTDVYSGVDLKCIYDEIKRDVVKQGMVQNFFMKIALAFDDFESQIKKYFPDEIEVAYKWQCEEPPNDMYYNHGMYMKFDKENGIKFIVNELNAKATSSRAIIPLIDFKKVIESGDTYLPSFNIVQFGFGNEDKTTLIVTLYLRALEVNYFLKINLCELYLMSKKVGESIRSVRNVDVNIHAFRAQYKEKFGCFVKAEIDLLSSADLLKHIYSENYDELIRLLRQKVDFCETIVNKDGIIELRKAVQAVSRQLHNGEAVLRSIKEIERAMEKLEFERRKTSNYAAVREEERSVQRSFEVLISIIERGDLYDISRDN